MHAYLFTGNDNLNLKTQISKLAEELNAKILEYPLVKISDVRNLNDFLKLSFKEPALIVCRDIHEAGEEALNAFLKNLEEPQENIYFALTSPSIKKVLPTIVSRCQVVKVLSTQYSVLNEDVEKFMTLSIGGKLNYIDKFKDRNLAIEFVENTIAFMHQTLHSDGSSREKELKYGVNVNNIRLALKTLSGLKANGNVNLQLSNFVINYG